MNKYIISKKYPTGNNIKQFDQELVAKNRQREQFLTSYKPVRPVAIIIYFTNFFTNCDKKL